MPLVERDQRECVAPIPAELYPVATKIPAKGLAATPRVELKVVDILAGVVQVVPFVEVENCPAKVSWLNPTLTQRVKVEL